MYKFITLLALISVVNAASIGVESSTNERLKIIPLIEIEVEINPDGTFGFSYEGDERSFGEETGVFENAGTNDEALEVSGSYRFIDVDGQEIKLYYKDKVRMTTGKDDFVPIGTNIPHSTFNEISAQAKAVADPPTEIDEVAVIRKVRDAAENERRQALKIERQIQKIEDKKNEKIDIQVGKISKIFDRADSIIMDALS